MRSYSVQRLHVLRGTVCVSVHEAVGTGSGDLKSRSGNINTHRSRCLHTIGRSRPRSHLPSPSQGLVPTYLAPGLLVTMRGGGGKVARPSTIQQKWNSGLYFRPSQYIELHNPNAGSASLPLISGSPRLPTSRLMKNPVTAPGFNTMAQLIIYLDDKIGSCPSVEQLITAYNDLLQEYLDKNGQVKLGRELIEEHSYVLMRVYEYLVELKAKEEALKLDSTDFTAVTNEGLTKPPASPLPLQVLKNTISVLHVANNADPPSAYFSKLLFADLMAREDISISALRSALYITQVAEKPSRHESELAQMLFNDIISRPDYEPLPSDYMCIAHVLSNTETANIDEALQICSAAWEKYGVQAITPEVWEKVLSGYVHRGNQQDFDRAWGLIVSGYKIRPDARMWHQRIAIHCNTEDLEGAKLWWKKLRTDPNAPEAALDTYDELMKLFNRRRKNQLADELLWYMITLYEDRPPGFGSQFDGNGIKKWWGAVTRWAGTNGVKEMFGIKPGKNSVDFIFKRITKLHNEGKTWVPLPDTDIFCEVLETFVQREKWELAEDILSLVDAWRMTPNRKLLSLKTQMLIQNEDWEGSWKTYENMKVYPIPDGDNAIELRKLIQGLAGIATGIGDPPPVPAKPAKEGRVKITWGKARLPPPFPPGTPAPLSKINYLLSDLTDRHLPLDANTLSALVVYHLSTNTLSSLPPLLNSTIYTLPASTIHRLLVIFLTHIRSPRASLLSAWDTYLIMQSHFPPSQIATPIRIALMQTFFSLNRSDMAIKILTDTPTPPPIPLAMFIIALKGLAQCKDIENLQLVHNLVNLSPEIPVPLPTELLNALMSAYAHCGLYERAMRFWGSIKNSRAGPDHYSISIVIDLCGRRKGWIGEAKKIWGTLRKYRITPSLKNYGAYVEAHARHGLYNEAWDIVKNMEAEGGPRPNDHVLSTLYNSVPRDRRGEVDHWASQAYPDIWNPWRRVGLERMKQKDSLSSSSS